MKSLGLSRYAVTIGAAATMLAGCGGLQPSVGALGPIPQSNVTVGHADSGRSWMLTDAGSGDLIYAEGGCGGVCILSYPGGKAVGNIADSNVSGGDCSDRNGNVYI